MNFDTIVDFLEKQNLEKITLNEGKNQNIRYTKAKKATATIRMTTAADASNIRDSTNKSSKSRLKTKTQV